MKLQCCKSKKLRGDLKNTVKFLRVISEENRIKILCLLKKKEMCVCNIWQYLGMSQNLTSHHLKILKEFGVIYSRKEGLKVFYKLNERAVKKYLKLLDRFLDSQNYGC